jgi:hypothetical protein
MLLFTESILARLPLDPLGGGSQAMGFGFGGGDHQIEIS